MEIKVLQEDDFQRSIDLISYAFCIQFTEELTAYWKSSFNELLNIGVIENEELIAQLSIIDMATYINGEVFNSGGITRVSSWPQKRRKGYVKQLILHALKEMKDKNQSISYLAPFDVGFYEKFGWIIYSEYKKYTFTDKNFPKYEQVDGYIEIPKKYEDVIKVYNEYMRQYNGSLVRDVKWYANHTIPRKKGITAIYYNEQNEPEGYVLYKIHNLVTDAHPKDFPIQRQLTVYELAYTTEHARRGLLNFIATHDSVVQTLVMTVPKDDILGYTLPKMTFKQEIIPYLMARIVDVEQFVSKYKFKSGEPREFLISVQDDYASWNDGVFLVSIDRDGKAQIQKVNQIEYDLKITIQDLSAILIGAQSLIKLTDAYRVLGNLEKIKLFNERIQESETFVVDFF